MGCSGEWVSACRWKGSEGPAEGVWGLPCPLRQSVTDLILRDFCWELQFKQEQNPVECLWDPS